jgi:hypothetical protein
LIHRGASPSTPNNKRDEAQHPKHLERVFLRSRDRLKVPLELKIMRMCRGTDLGSPICLSVRCQYWGPGMSQVVQSFYEADSFYERPTLRLVRERIGHCLRERYQVPTELPAKLLALVRKVEAIESRAPRARTLIGTLDAIEGDYLKRCGSSVEPRSVSASDDWPLCT